MAYRPEFDLKLKEGEIAEKKLAEVFRSDGKIEVKYDRICRTSKNVCVEFCQNDYNGGKKKSGILITTAAYWAIEFYDDVFLLVATEKLRRVASDYKKQFPKSVQNCGDNGNRAVMVPLTELVLRLLRT